ncbi:hypothetical protein CsatA_016543 [Cannabis sativa]
MTSPTHSQSQDQTLHSKIPDPPQNDDSQVDSISQFQSSKTLTLESPSPSQSSKIITLESPNPPNPDHQQTHQDPGNRQNPLDLDQNDDEVDDSEDLPAPSPRTSESNLMPSPAATALATPSITSVYRRGAKRKKIGNKRRVQERKSLQKLEVLKQKLRPIPFVPVKSLDFSSHEKLLKRLGLWDFVHMEFDRFIRGDLLAQLIANFNLPQRCSYVCGARVLVNRADLARALKLPVKKVAVSDEADEAPIATEESIAFLEEFVSNWLLLHDELWMMPNEILNWTKAIKDGSFEKVDWAGMIWFMIEKELMQAPTLTDCYYASHLQRLIKSQRGDLLLSEVPKVEIDIDLKEDADDFKEEEEDHTGNVKISGEGEGDHKEDVKMSGEGDLCGQGLEEAGQALEESSHELQEHGHEVMEHSQSLEDSIQVLEESRHELEEHNIELSLGQDNMVEKPDAQKEQVADVSTMDFEGCKEEEHGQWFMDQKNNVSEFLRQCNHSELKEELDVEDEGKHEEYDLEIGQEQEHQDVVEPEEDDDEEEEMEEQGGQDGCFHFSPKSMGMDGLASGGLAQSIDAADISLGSGMPLRDPLAGDFLPPRNDTPMTSHFGNGSKRELGMINDGSHHPLNANKRLRMDGSWDNGKSSSDTDSDFDQMIQTLVKLKSTSAEKEHALQEANVNQQILMDELQKRENMIQHMNKVSYEEEHKRRMEVYRLERELYLMSSLVDGYKKALKETHRAFAEYRERCPQLDEPLYKDVAGSGGLVLSTIELEKQRLKREEEERRIKLEIEMRVNNFGDWWSCEFTGNLESVDALANKLLNLENETKLLKESFASRRVSETIEPASNDLELAQKVSEPPQEVSGLAPESAQKDSEAAPEYAQKDSELAAESAQKDSELARESAEKDLELAPESVERDLEPAQEAVEMDIELALENTKLAQKDSELAPMDAEPAEIDAELAPEPAQNDSASAQNDSDLAPEPPQAVS